MKIGGSTDIHGIGAIVVAREPLSQHYAHQWLLIDSDEMVSATLVRRVLRQGIDANRKGPRVGSESVSYDDVLFMKKCMSTACHRRKAVAFGRGRWGESTTLSGVQMTWLSSIVSVLFVVYVVVRFNLLKLCMVKCILWLRRKYRGPKDYRSR